MNPGTRVKYRPHPDAVPEYGIVSSFALQMSGLAFVMYDGDVHAKATPLDRLEVVE